MWDVIGKSVNSNLKVPLNELIEQKYESIQEKLSDDTNSNTDISGSNFVPIYNNLGTRHIGTGETTAANINVMISDEDFIYTFQESTAGGKITKFRKSDLTKVSETTGFNKVATQDSNYLYVGEQRGSSSTSRVMRYNKDNLASVFESPTLGGSIWGIEEDESYVYVLIRSVRRIRRLNKSDLTTNLETSQFSSEINLLRSDDEFLYFSQNRDFHKAHKSDLSTVNTVSLSTSYSAPENMVLDDKYAYVFSRGTTGQPGLITKIEKETLNIVGEFVMPTGLSGITVDDKMAYIGFSNVQGVSFYDKETFSLLFNTSQADANSHNTASIVVDGDFVYFGGVQAGGRAVQKITNYELYEKLGYRRV